MDNKTLIQRLRPFVTEERFALLQRVLDQRTRYMTVVLEQIHNTHNSSAVLRTSDCLGIQDVNIIGDGDGSVYTIHPDIVRGSAKWLTINVYDSFADNSAHAAAELKRAGYRIVATTPHGGRAVDLYDFDVAAGPFAIVIGSEKRGVSDYILQNADEHLTVPMVGFTESYNLSVCAALIMSHLRREMQRLGIVHSLPDDEKDEIMVKWLLGSIRSSDLILKRILEQG